MKKIALYPVTPKNLYIVKAIKTNHPDVDVDTIVVPNVFTKSVEIEMGQSVNIVHRVSDIPKEIDELLILSFWNYDIIKESIIEAIRMKMNIVCVARVKESDAFFLHELSSNAGVDLSFLNNENTLEFIRQHGEMYTPQSSIIIAFGALTKGIRTSESIVELKAVLESHGYSTSVVSSDPDLQLLGYDYLPMEQMIEKNLDNTVMEINRFFTHLETANKPNIIILQLPNEGLHRISLDYETCFGALTYLISQAVGIDYAVMLSPIIDPDAALYQELNQISKYRYGFGYNCVCILPQVIDTNSPQGAEDVDYCIVTSEQMIATTEALKESAKEINYSDTLFISKQREWLTEVGKNVVDNLS